TGVTIGGAGYGRVIRIRATRIIIDGCFGSSTTITGTHGELQHGLIASEKKGKLARRTKTMLANKNEMIADKRN
uniref:Uncharacterized protein n=1 Tax=Romanomermis culicivorax TaxID=13658 RepID=A0A915IX24_ROMCU